MHCLTIIFASHAEFLEHYSTDYAGSDKHANGALFCRTKVIAAKGEKVIVDISIPGLRRPARLSGSVVAASTTGGLWIYFDSKSRASAEYLASLTEINADRLSRAHSRYPASWDVRFRVDETGQQTRARTTRISDLSRGGAFVIDDDVPLVGTRVSLEIGSPAMPYKVSGRVAWTGTVGNAQGFGVRFDQRGAQNASLRTMLRQASEKGLLGLDDRRGR
ncbi:MAG: PilZ domain-containing protein [Kofleriaceae bacterium]|nr:PilZ domain-containing protein [Kofleriaceae bacterium]